MGLCLTAENSITDGVTGGSAYTKYNNANAYLGVGDSTTAFANTQTDLQSSSNKTRVGMNATYPSVATNVITAQSTFSTGQANYAWNEWGFFNASTAGQMFNREVSSLGTKTATATWQLTITITINV